MIGDSLEECEARLSELRHIHNFIEILIKEREKELEEAKKEAEKK